MIYMSWKSFLKQIHTFWNCFIFNLAIISSIDTPNFVHGNYLIKPIYIKQDLLIVHFKKQFTILTYSKLPWKCGANALLEHAPGFWNRLLIGPARRAGKLEVMHNLAHVLIEYFTFFGTGFFFSRDLLLFFSQKNVFSFFSQQIYCCFFTPKNILLFGKITVNPFRKKQILYQKKRTLLN
jgi:hypothetical protein